ncbi:hypothetical protein NDU88_007955 [Pleurodeles waltl]|uniref:Uncharacterized protein n=1 Tax=Pleurodeles waltl TaxID=8319 RepID=A0AAV7NXU0_PLEWA|nr:hypothetical protein NDU88_007955 [Pleurodeles waltl]
MDFRLQRKKKEQKKWLVVVTALLTTVAAIVLTTILIVYKDDIHIPWLDQEHYIPKSGQGEGATGGGVTMYVVLLVVFGLGEFMFAVDT